MLIVIELFDFVAVVRDEPHKVEVVVDIESLCLAHEDLDEDRVVAHRLLVILTPHTHTDSE